MYDRGWLRSFRFDFPVILVGNISTGGTGKTPHVIMIAELLKKHFRIAVLSRGYKRKTKGYIVATDKSLVEDIGDEPKLMKWKSPSLEVAVCEDRLEGISQLLLEEPSPQIIIMDDGFQHRAVKAGYNIILTSYSKPFTTDRLLPYGNLREPRTSLHRADTIIVSKCPADMSKREASEMRTSLQLMPAHALFFTCYQYGAWQPLLPDQPQQTMPPLKSALIISALASNEYLLDHLKKQCRDLDVMHYPDHYYYKPADLSKIKEKQGGNRVLITTDKDAVKLRELEADITKLELSFFVLPVTVQFLFDGEDRFQEAINRYVRDAKSLI